MKKGIVKMEKIMENNVKIILIVMAEHARSIIVVVALN